MTHALYLLNAVALAALVSFHYSSDHKDPAEIHSQVAQSIQAPAARLAVMNPQSSQARLFRAQEGSAGSNDSSNAEHYIF
jgi:hypothetical protein